MGIFKTNNTIKFLIYCNFVGSGGLRLLLIIQERLDVAAWNFDCGLRLMRSVFVPNFKAIDDVTSVLEPENRRKSLA